MQDLYPVLGNRCACGCGKELKGRQKKWASSDCSTNSYNQFAVLKGNSGMIRKILYSNELGFCRMCGVQVENWHADHIIPVYEGGGACDITNFQTLCIDCHKQKHSTKPYPNAKQFLRKMPLMQPVFSYKHLVLHYMIQGINL